ncbi:hypothetical protein F4810DRAFT_609904 [Camillea tinctor]|nr:hypothetical protein F4810DRAFT_609904 [Camillea tinctor]
MPPSPDLGLSCPQGGKFYVCGNSTTRFLGCCEQDPCNSEITSSALNSSHVSSMSGWCPAGALKPASFSASAYDAIPPQDCAPPPYQGKPALWYTCGLTLPPFLGCCTENPCNGNYSATWFEEYLATAVLSDNATSAAVFLGSDADNSTGQDQVQTESGGGGDAPPAGKQPDKKNKQFYLGMELTIGVTALVVILAIVGFLVCKRRRKKKRERQQQHSDSSGQDSAEMGMEPLTKPPQLPPPPALSSNRYSELTVTRDMGSFDNPRVPPPTPPAPPARPRPRPYSGPTNIANMANWTLRPERNSA